jgi:hypothetical protein
MDNTNAALVPVAPVDMITDALLSILWVAKNGTVTGNSTALGGDIFETRVLSLGPFGLICMCI